MNNDACLTEGNVLQPEVVSPALKSPRNLITVMVLSITLAHQILGKQAPKEGKLKPGQGAMVIKAIETAIKKSFPDQAPMVLGLFGIEMMGLMPMLQEPEKVISEMIDEYQGLINPNVNPNTEPNVG